MHARLTMIISLSMLLVLMLAAPPSKADQYDLSTPFCPTPYVVKGAKCEADTVAVSKLTAGDCLAVGGQMDGGACKLVGPAPTPACHSVAGGTQTLKGEKCMFDNKIETSASGDYVGDYFQIVAVPADDVGRLGGPPGTQLKVLSQKNLGQNDRMLTLLAIRPTTVHMFNDSPTGNGAGKEVKASDLIEYGAKRTGWTYGALAIPYKYYASDKSFGPGVAIGPYVGRRWGTPGSAYTAAITATIGNVKGEVRDAQDKIISTPDLMAYSVAAGAMWDISKAQGVKPFKMGVFVGVDSVSSDNVVKFKNNRKTWVALQIGFDFTDN